MANRPAIPIDTRKGIGGVSFTLSGQPDTLTLVDNGDGSAEITGAIAAGEAASSPYTTIVTATDDANETDSESFTITVVTVLALDTIDDQSLVEGEAITPVEVSVTSGTGETPYVLSASGLPSGLTFTDDGDGTGSISGTPATGTEASSPYTVIVTATDGAGQVDTEEFTATVVRFGPSRVLDESTFPTLATIASSGGWTTGFRVQTLSGTGFTSFEMDGLAVFAPANGTYDLRLYDSGGTLIDSVQVDATADEWTYGSFGTTHTFDDSDVFVLAAYSATAGTYFGSRTGFTTDNAFFAQPNNGRFLDGDGFPTGDDGSNLYGIMNATGTLS